MNPEHIHTIITHLRAGHRYRPGDRLTNYFRMRRMIERCELDPSAPGCERLDEMRWAVEEMGREI